ncbi:MAG: hypothetical protein ACUVT2_07020 [Thiobacillaceae bacterium]
MEHSQAEQGERQEDWEDMDEAPAPDDFYDDLAHLYLFSGGVWPDGLSPEQLPRLEQALRIGDFFEDLGPDLEK